MMYLYNSMTMWRYKWLKNGFMNACVMTVANQDVIHPIKQTDIF